MSFVTGFTLHYGNHEETSDNIKKIIAWIEQRDFPPPHHVELMYGGTKHPQVTVLGAGYNYFPTDDFIAFFIELEKWWWEPETVVLILNPEEGGAVVIRGTDKQCP